MPKIIIDVDNHRVGTEPVPIGTEIDVPEQTAQWMIAKGKAHFSLLSPANKPAKPTLEG